MKIFTMVLTNSACMTPVILVLLALRPLLRRRMSPHTRYYAWLLALLGLMIPFSLNPARQAAVTLALPESRNLVIPAQAERSQVGGSRIVGEETAASRAFIADHEVRTYQATLSEVISRAAPSPLPFTLQWPDPVTAMGILWLGGMTAFYLIQGIRQARFMRLVRRWQSPPTPLQAQAAEQEAESLGLSGLPRLRRCACIASPMLVGLFRPILLLPETQLAPKELRFILRHELTHYRKGDLWYKAFMLGVAGIHWFNPAVLLMCRAIASDCEISCDKSVLKAARMPERKQYGETILGVIRRQKQQPVALSTHFYERKGGIKKRFAAMLDQRDKPKGYVLLALCLVMTLMAGNVLALSPYEKDEKGLAYDADWRSRFYPRAFPSIDQLSPALTYQAEREDPAAANRLLTLGEARRLYDLYYLYDGEGLRAPQPVSLGPGGESFALSMTLSDYIACMERDELGATYRIREEARDRLPFLLFPDHEMTDHELLQLIELQDALLLLEPITYRIEPAAAHQEPEPNRSMTRRELLRNKQLRSLYQEDERLRPRQALTTIPGEGLYVVGYNGGGETVYHYPEGRELTDEEHLEMIHTGMQAALSWQAARQNEAENLDETAELNSQPNTPLSAGTVDEARAFALAQGYLGSEMPEEKFLREASYDPVAASWQVSFRERVPNGAPCNSYQAAINVHTGRLEAMSCQEAACSSYVFISGGGDPLIAPLLPQSNYFIKGDGTEAPWQETAAALLQALALYNSPPVSIEPSPFFSGDTATFTVAYQDGNLARLGISPLTGGLISYTFYTPETVGDAHWYQWETELPVNE